MTGPRCALALAAALFATPILATQCPAQDYPVRPVKIIVPFGAGGPADVTARLIGNVLQENFGQPFTQPLRRSDLVEIAAVENVDQIDVRAQVELICAELAHREHTKLVRDGSRRELLRCNRKSSTDTLHRQPRHVADGFNNGMPPEEVADRDFDQFVPLEFTEGGGRAGQFSGSRGAGTHDVNFVLPLVKKALKVLLAANRRLNTAYVLKESFGQLWSYEREGWARRFFENWRASLKWQRLPPYEKFAEMIDRHWDGIAAYCRLENKVSLGFVEGLNNKIRVIQRRAYGLRDEDYLRLKILTCMLPAL